MTTPVPLLARYAGPPAVPGYRVDRFLGRGSAGVVWAGTEDGTGRRVALKVMDPDEANGAALELVEREEAISGRLTSQHVVTVRGRVRLDDGRVAVVMRLAGGGTLRDVVTVRGALPLGEVVTALTPVATALSELHAAGVVHADVAPGNVLFTSEGRPLLTDLSSARLLEDGWTAAALGTTGFAAPEVALGGPPVPASDVWSLGALAWYARTGGHTPPSWLGELHWAMSAGQTPTAAPHEEKPGTLDDVSAAVGAELTPLLLRMLAEDPDVRPTAAEAALGLYRAGAPRPVGLVGHHPDPAAAVTTRIRRDAAETRTRTQLRQAERAEHRLRRREVRRSRLRRVFSLRRPPVSGGTSNRRHDLLGGWRRLAIVLTVGLVLSGGMVGLLRLTGGPLDMATASVAEAGAGSWWWAFGDGSSGGGRGPDELTARSAPGAASGSLSAGGSASGSAPASAPRSASASGSASGSVSASGSASAPMSGPPSGAAPGSLPAAASASATEPASGPASMAPRSPVVRRGSEPVPSGGSTDRDQGPPSPSAVAGPSRGDPNRDPVAVLQQLADGRAAALMAADLGELAAVELTGSPAYETDRQNIERLRGQQQGYLDLILVVRSADVTSVTSEAVVLRAVVDRSAYRVVTEGGDAQAIEAAPGEPLTYTVARGDGGWRLTEVGPP